jgi:hypothetical protein
VTNVPGADWQAATLQLVLFTQRAIPLNSDIYSAIAGSPPESQEDRPKQATRTQTGALGDIQLRVILTPIRIDVIVAPPPIDASAHVTMGELKAELGKFAKLILDWVPRWDVPTTRISLIVNALTGTSSLEAAYEVLRENLSSVRVRPGEMGDLIFRVNWRAKTGTTDEGYYNRVTTWSTHRFALTATTTTLEAAVPLQMLDFASVQMDLNTPAERTAPLPPEKLSTMFKELHQIAIEIADTGEHP